MITLLAATHLLALPLGCIGIFVRFKELATVQRGGSLKGVYFGDNLWGVAAVIWISTGLFRLFGGLEKGSAYYLQSPWFFLKMVFFGFVFALEVFPMVTLMRWRIQRKEVATQEDMRNLGRMKAVSIVELILIFIIPMFAVAMARGGFY